VARSEMNRVHASQFVPSTYIANDPQIPSRHKRQRRQSSS
jgi:hypothetical protein